MVMGVVGLLVGVTVTTIIIELVWTEAVTAWKAITSDVSELKWRFLRSRFQPISLNVCRATVAHSLTHSLTLFQCSDDSLGCSLFSLSPTQQQIRSFVPFVSDSCSLIVGPPLDLVSQSSRCRPESLDLVSPKMSPWSDAVELRWVLAMRPTQFRAFFSITCTPHPSEENQTKRRKRFTRG